MVTENSAVAELTYERMLAFDDQCGVTALSEAGFEDYEEGENTISTLNSAPHFRHLCAFQRGSANLKQTETMSEIVSKRALVSRLPEAAREVLEEAIRDSLRFLSLLPFDPPTPMISVAEDGELVLEWHGDAGSLVAGFEGGGEYGYALKYESEFVPGDHLGHVTGPLPDDLVDILRMLAG